MPQVTNLLYFERLNWQTNRRTTWWKLVSIIWRHIRRLYYIFSYSLINLKLQLKFTVSRPSIFKNMASGRLSHLELYLPKTFLCSQAFKTALFCPRVSTVLVTNRNTDMIWQAIDDHYCGTQLTPGMSKSARLSRRKIRCVHSACPRGLAKPTVRNRNTPMIQASSKVYLFCLHFYSWYSPWNIFHNRVATR